MGNINYLNSLPNFLVMQRISFCWFVSQGLSEELSIFSKMYDFSRNTEYILFGEEYSLIKPPYSLLIARKYSSNYKAKLIIPLEVRNRKDNNIKYQKQFSMISLPLMTSDATFVTNGCERVIVSQIIRSPGIYFQKNKNQKPHNKFRKKLLTNAEKVRSFFPSGVAFISVSELSFPISDIIREKTISKYIGKNGIPYEDYLLYTNKEEYEEAHEDIMLWEDFLVSINVKEEKEEEELYWKYKLISKYSLKYINSIDKNFYFLECFNFYQIISQSLQKSSKVQLIQLFLKWLKLKNTSLKWLKINDNSSKKNLYLLECFNFLLRLVINYKLFQTDCTQSQSKLVQIFLAKFKNNTKISITSEVSKNKILKLYNKLIINSQNLANFQLNSKLFFIDIDKSTKITSFSFLKQQERILSPKLSNIEQLLKSQILRPTIYFSTSLKDQLKIRRKKNGKALKSCKPKNQHKYLKTKAHILLFNKDHEINTSYNEKYDKKELYTATLIPEYGSWIRFGFQKNTKLNSYRYPLKNPEDEIIIQMDKIDEKPILYLLREMGLTDLEICQNLYHSDFFYFTKPLLIRSKIFNQPLSRFNLNSKYFKKISEFSKIFDPTYYRLGRVGRLKLNSRLNLSVSDRLLSITYDDIFAIVDELISLAISKIIEDDIDHLKNRRVRPVGELLQNLFRIGFQRLSRKLKNQINKVDLDQLLNFNIVNVAINEFFGTSQLSQYLDQTNPLSSLTHRRRISGFGPGGFDRDRISFAVRDIHPSHYGRICPIETSEGKNVGLISSLTTYARINKFGFLETPFWRVINGKVLKTCKPIYLTADIEDFYKIAPADVKVNKENYLLKNRISVRYKQDFISVGPAEVDFIAISTIQIVSVAASLIPFFEHDDANRALMGSNMQRQSVPLILPQKPIVGTGLENQIARDSGMALNAQSSGIVSFVTANKIVIKDKNKNKITYTLHKYLRSNQQTCINHRPIVWKGEIVRCGQILTDGPAITSSELSLGQNVLVGYMPWQGYNFEDAILINERLVYDNIFTSIHIDRYKIIMDQNGEIYEEITKDIPNLDPSELAHLNDDGIIRVGTFVKPGDILVGKVIFTDAVDQRPEAKLLRAIFGTKSKGIKNNSYKVPNGKYGRIIETIILNRKIRSTYKFEKIYIFLAQIRKIQVGDKIAGRHGNKGIISRILSMHDMPFLPDGTPIDIILNPLGVPSRMNVGQLYECLLGLAGDKLNRRFKVLPFDEMYGIDISRILINKKLRQASKIKNQSWLFNPYAPGKMILMDGRTGLEFENPITVGNAYMLKLIHLVDDKMHARATGPYSLVTQQPLRGKAQQGGQRFGEMEVWALEGFGAAFTLKELLTIKSDDLEGRDETLYAIIKGHQIPKFGIPESFKVLLNELRAIGLDMSVYKLQKFSSNKKYENEINLLEEYNASLKTFQPNSDTDITDIVF